MKHNHIAERITALRATLPQGVTLIAVSKYHPVEAVQAAYDAGQRDFGESKAQDLKVKYGMLPKDIKWHFIGHLQRLGLHENETAEGNDRDGDRKGQYHNAHKFTRGNVEFGIYGNLVSVDCSGYNLTLVVLLSVT